VARPMKRRERTLTDVLVVGATSAIGSEVARSFARSGARLFLVARNAERLAAVSEDLRVLGAGRVETAVLDVTHMDRHAAVLQSAIEALGDLDVALVAHGVLPDQSRCEASVEETLRALEVNCTSTVALLTLLANYFEQRRGGCIAVITSVAGDRGRRSNYVYGTAKAALNTFLEGLRARLQPAGVSVLTVKPGFVDTPMTAGLPRNPFYADPRRVGEDIYRAMLAGRDVVYVPWFWRPIMAAVRAIPVRIFKRISP